MANLFYFLTLVYLAWQSPLNCLLDYVCAGKDVQKFSQMFYSFVNPTLTLLQVNNKYYAHMLYWQQLIWREYIPLRFIWATMHDRFAKRFRIIAHTERDSTLSIWLASWQWLTILNKFPYVITERTCKEKLMHCQKASNWICTARPCAIFGSYPFSLMVSFMITLYTTAL